MARLEIAEHNTASGSTSVDESLRGLSNKLYGFNKNTREAIAELQSSLKNTTARLEVIEGVPPSPLPMAGAEPAADTVAEPSAKAQALPTFRPAPAV